jgi:hypothetical protein
VPQAWDLAGIAADYRRFLRRFGASSTGFATPATDHDPEQCFVVRTLLIHAYRRVLPRDPRLPAALLPLDWPGAAAFALCRDFYRLTHRSAETASRCPARRSARRPAAGQRRVLRAVWWPSTLNAAPRGHDNAIGARSSFPGCYRPTIASTSTLRMRSPPSKRIERWRGVAISAATIYDDGMLSTTTHQMLSALGITRDRAAREEIGGRAGGGV